MRAAFDACRHAAVDRRLGVIRRWNLPGLLRSSGGGRFRYLPFFALRLPPGSAFVPGRIGWLSQALRQAIPESRRLAPAPYSAVSIPYFLAWRF